VSELDTHALICDLCGGALSGRPAITGVDRQVGTPGSFAVHICEQCGAGVTIPRVDTPGLAAFYPDEYGPFVQQQGLISRLASVYYRWRDAHVFRRKPYSAVSSRPPGSSLVDVGCGRGDLGVVFLARGWKVTGVDPSPEACEAVRVRGMTAIEGTLDTVSLPAQAYDAASFQHALEHTSYPLRDLERVHAALRDDGQVLIAVPNFGYWQRKLFGTYWFPLDLPRHRFHFTAESLRIVLTRAGFSGVDVTPVNDFVGLPASLQYLLFKRCVFASGASRGIGYLICASLYPMTWTLQKLLGNGDFLHVVARKPAAGSPAPLQG
jgi:SAM-dependent methyltransferase